MLRYAYHAPEDEKEAIDRGLTAFDDENARRIAMTIAERLRQEGMEKGKETAMPFQRFFLLATILIWISAPARAAEREILFLSESPSPALESILETLQDPDTPPIPYAELPEDRDYYARIAPREYVIAKPGALADNAVLGTKPYVFMTTPEGLYGKNLLQLYLDIGYEAEDILQWQRDVPMVAVIFRYEDDIARHPGRDGNLPAEHWDRHVYVPTWDNIFPLFEKLTAKADIAPDQTGHFAPWRFFFHSEAEKGFVLGFPEAGKARIRATDYAVLRETGGADWVYRKLLEDKLSLFEHFRGNGRTLNELKDPMGERPDTGLYEFVGPNQRLAELPEIAAVSLGALRVTDAAGAE